MTRRAVVDARKKLNQARFFYNQMSDSLDLPDNFLYYLSAFLASANSVRSVISRSRKDASFKQWWDNQTIQAEPLTQFFDNKRHLDIHEEVVTPQQTVAVAVHEVLRVSESISIQVTRADGTVEPPVTYADPPQPPAEAPPTTVTRSYTFPDSPGPKDVLQACYTYLARLTQLVEDAERQP